MIKKIISMMFALLVSAGALASTVGVTVDGVRGLTQGYYSPLIAVVGDTVTWTADGAQVKTGDVVTDVPGRVKALYLVVEDHMRAYRVTSPDGDVTLSAGQMMVFKVEE